MPSAKEIKSSMRGVKDTMKITKAMYMISTIKMRKAKHQLELTEPYFYGLQQEMTKLLRGFPDVKTEFFGERLDESGEQIEESVKSKKIGYIVLSSDRGLAGAYNHNLFNAVEAAVKGKSFDEYELFVVGKLGMHTLEGRGYNVRKDFSNTVTNPNLTKIRFLAEHFIELYLSGEIDEFHVIYTRMVNAMESAVDMQQLLPFKRENFIGLDFANIPRHTLESGAVDEQGEEDKHNPNMEQIVYPSPEVVLDEIVRSYVTGFLYGSFVEATACEENARMTAMKSATDNAKELLKKLTIQYNRVRQAAITQQITEISSGARAMRQKKKQLLDEVKGNND